MAFDRNQALSGLLSAGGFAGGEVRPLAADASFRSYHRVHGPDGRRAVLMDAPPDKEDVRPFRRIAEILLSWGLSAPRVLAAHDRAGYLLLEDLGDDLFGRLIRDGADPAPLYAAAIDVLVALAAQPTPQAVPAYDMDTLLTETDLFLEWRFPEDAGQAATETQRASWRAAWRKVLTHVSDTRSVLVLRDYHVDNLIWLPDRAGIQRAGLLDFQDALIGHPAYDLASLLSDVRRDVDAALEAAMFERYVTEARIPDPDALRRDYAILAAQRNAKILGIFTRLSVRDGKHAYRGWLPRTWRLLRRDLGHPALAPVAEWLREHLSADPAEQEASA